MSYNKIYIFFSSLKEANSLLFQSKFKFIKKDNYYSYKEKIELYISGIGKNNTLNFIKNLNLENNSIIFKVGTCGILNNIEILKPFIPSFVFHQDKKIYINKDILKNIEDKILVHNKGLLTVLNPISSLEEKQIILEQGFSLVDMETFFIMDNFNNIPTIPILVGTDRGDCNSKIDFIKNINQASVILKDCIEKIIHPLF